jgi:hypothetical protein
MSNEINTIIKEKGQELFNIIIDELKKEPYNFTYDDFIMLILDKFYFKDIEKLYKECEEQKTNKQI